MPLNVGVVLSSTYRAGGDILYGREGNSAWSALEDVVGRLEGGRCLVFSSGIAAVAAVIETLPAGASVVVDQGSYNGTRRLLADLAGRGRLRWTAVDTTDAGATLDACRGASLLWLESPTNPKCDVCDLPALIGGAHDQGVAVAVDNTFATPLLQKPLEMGADFVVHSVTKLLAGHSDVVLGAVVARSDALIDALVDRRTLHGAIAGPLEAFLALQGLRTLAVRLERAQANASVLAHRLVEHPAVTRVRYPGLASDPGHALARRQMRGFGSMLAFEVPDAGQADAVCSATRLAVNATSLGGVETLLERRSRYGFEETTPAGLIRVSVGIENVEDLWADLGSALDALGAPAG
ncbi:MAG TPA: PLP-dependent transferase [Acidimicrobiales bacterium]|nr:PLP-dependent transferase [Acidimicrobiales bacterium]